MGAKTWMLVGGDGDAREVLRSKPALVGRQLLLHSG